MKKNFIVIGGLVIGITVAGMLCNVRKLIAFKQSQSLKPYILDEHNHPQPALLKLLQITNIEHNATLDDIVEQTQKTWLRKPGTERWESGNDLDALADSYMPIFKELGCITEVKPQKQLYDYCLLFGGILLRVRDRLAYILELWKRGIRFKTLVILSGQRSLEPFESGEELVNLSHDTLALRLNWQQPAVLPMAECQMIQFVLDQVALPADFKPDVQFIDVPMFDNGSGNLRRPTTKDTIDYWLATKPIPGNVVAVSMQPFVGFQDSVTRTYVPTTFTIETVGSAYTPTTCNIRTIFDSLARWLYQEKTAYAQK